MMQTLSQSASDSTCTMYALPIMPDIHPTDAPSALRLSTERRIALNSELGRLPTLYIPDGFHALLCKTGLDSIYPTIVHDIRYGLPIGNPTQLTETFIPKNMKTALENPKLVDEHIREEVETGRMTGPFSIEEAHHIFGGHFRTTPLGLVQKEENTTKWRVIRNASKKDSYGVSVNDMIESDDFPTRWNSAWIVAQYVSSMSLSYFWGVGDMRFYSAHILPCVLVP